jgi:mono/diheme cytochrome c family protein
MVRLTMLLLIALLLGHGHGPGTPDTKPPVESTATAEDIWKSRCKGCHKETGEGSQEKKVPDFRDATWQSKHSDDKIRESILNGEADTKMKAFKGKMTDAQLDAIIKYIRAFKQ